VDPNKLKIYLELDGEQYKSELSKSKKSIQTFGDEASSSGKKIQKSSVLSEKSLKRIKFAALAVGVAMGAMAYKLKNVLNAELKNIDAQAKMADRYGVTMEAMAGFEHLAGLTGNTVDGLGKAVQQLELRMGRAAAGTGEARKVIEKLGLSFQEISDMEPDKAMYRLAEAIQGVSSSTEQAYIANELFGREGRNMLGVIKEQGSEMAVMAGEASEYAHIMSREAAAGVEEFNDNMFRLSRRMGASKTKMAADLTPALNRLSKALLSASEDGRLLSNVMGLITRGIEGVINATTKIINELSILSGTATEVMELNKEIERTEALIKAEGMAITKIGEKFTALMGVETGNRDKRIKMHEERLIQLREELKAAEEIEEHSRKADFARSKEGQAQIAQLNSDLEQARLAVAEFTKDFEKAVSLEMKIEKDALLEQLEETYGEGIEHQREYNEARAAVEQEYQEQIKRIQDEALIRTAANEQADVAFKEAALRAKFGLESRAMMATQELTSVAAQLQGDSNEAFHKAGQAAASAQIIIDAAQAVMKAWAINPFVGAAMAGIIARVKANQLKEVWSSPKPERAEIEPAPLPSFAQGAWRVPADMVAQVHKDETIMPKPFAEEYREQVSGTYNFNFAGSFYDKNGLAEATAESLQIIKRQTGNDLLGGNVY
jgi:hypothetical protein